MKYGTVLACALAASLGSAASADLVTNGGFETGDFTGWTQWGDGSFTGVSTGPGSSGAYSGSFNAYFGPTGGNGGIQQVLAVTAGTQVTVDFYLAQAFGSTGTSMFASLDGQTLVSLTDYADPNYEHFSATVTVANDNPVLQFGFFDPPDYYQLDNVSANAAPAPGSAALLGLGGLIMGRRRRR
jgi:MYXO-CTERM domain-containing protein